jgi:hypothetical protein
MEEAEQMGAKREHKLGSRLADSLGIHWQYGKVDFGIAGRDTKTGKIYRDIRYLWIPQRMPLPYNANKD